MSASMSMLAAAIVDCLRTLCAQPSSVGRPDELARSANLIATLLRRLGMQVYRVDGHGPPVVIGRRAGRTPRTLLLYHRFDAPPPGPWRAWSHDPFQLAERDGAVYGRGVAEGKGPLAAHLQALAAMIADEGDLPCGVTVVADGGGLIGSPGLAAAIAAHGPILRADACLGSVGDRAASGAPLCYSGSKGLLQVRLRAQGPAHPLPPGAASTLPNPLWRLTWALAAIKGEDEDIRIPGFYDSVEGPSREENALLRQLKLDEAGRLAAWGAAGFLFGMQGAPLVRAEVTLPTCNLSAIRSFPEGDLAVLPAGAEAALDFHLAPNQHPAEIARLVRAHLDEKGFTDVTLEVLPGGYSPARTPPDAPFIRQLAAAGAVVHGVMLPVAPAGAFALPLQPFVEAHPMPCASVGVARPDSALFGPDEHIPLEDLARHGQLLIEVLLALAGE
ncbi:MAG: M20/M25/M40 family metallo-hydrolase [Oscillochloridaceae bacterium]|nr:M20/M25/M40 family metallo-hydrolase [Chloroflexaceae bacterium]MDW8390630.1 M20/M25/M40 family metallo-hydrolase [Oscillochloridaceae bacterium]